MLVLLISAVPLSKQLVNVFMTGNRMYALWREAQKLNFSADTGNIEIKWFSHVLE